MTTRVTDLFLSGDHASRPAESTVPIGALYVCSTHGTIDKNVAGTWTTWATLGATYDGEAVRDTIGTALVAGAGISVTVNDGADTITIANTGPDAEAVRDTIGAALVAGTGISVTVNDAGDTITIANTGGGLDAEAVRDTIGTALVAGSGISITVDDAGDTITITNTGAASRSINTQTGTSYTLVLGDAGKFVTMNNAGASTLTVPPNSSVAFPVGTLISGIQLGAGQVTLTAGVGVTVNATPGLKVAAQYGTFELLKIATDTWVAYGRLSA